MRCVSHQVTGADVAFIVQKIPDRMVQPNWMAASVAVCRDRYRGSRPPYLAPGINSEERLIAEADHHGFNIEGSRSIKRLAKRRHLTLREIGVVDHGHRRIIDRQPYCPRNDNCAVEARRSRCLEGPLKNGTSVQERKQLVCSTLESAS